MGEDMKDTAGLINRIRQDMDAGFDVQIVGDPPLRPLDRFVATITTGIPYGIEGMEPYLRPFFEGMVSKLHANRHKEPPRHCDVLKFLWKIHTEVGELIQQCHEDRSSPNLHQELYDIANYAFLMGLSLHLEEEDQKKLRSPPQRRLSQTLVTRALACIGLQPLNREAAS